MIDMRSVSATYLVRSVRFVSIGFICCFQSLGAALAANVSVREDQVLVTGTITDEDAVAFRSLVESNHRLTTVVFEQCLGGTASAAFALANTIQERSLNTVAAKQCSSACALAFLAGTTRSFANRIGTNAISLHAARTFNGKTRASDALNRRVMEALETSTKGRLDPKLRNLISQSWSPASGLLFVRHNFWLWKRDEVLYCEGSQGADTNKCSRLEGFDAFSQGIVTEP